MGLADHDAVVCQINCSEVEMLSQFFISRNYKNINAGNILPLLDQDLELQSLFSDMDPDTIAHKLNNGLNNIAKNLI